jgi:hypothetical protein
MPSLPSVTSTPKTPTPKTPTPKTPTPKTLPSQPSGHAAAARPTPRPGPPRVPKPSPAPRRPAAPVHPHTPEAPSPGPEVQLIPAEAALALDRADATVDLLLDAGRSPSQVLVLTTGDRHPWQQHEESFGSDGYWAQLDDASDVFYADAVQCRPVRREVVVLAVNGGSPDTARQALASARDRAVSLVVVCGDASVSAPLYGLVP